MKLCVAILTVLLAGRAWAAPVETKSFPAQPGDTLVIQNDYGRVQVRASSGAQVEATARATLASGGTEHVRLASQKAGDRIFLYSFFGDTPGESVDLEVQAPRFVNVMISGANPEVVVQGMDGYVRVSSMTGQITAEDLTSSVSLISDRGDIVYHLRTQPSGDARIETAHGQVGCELAPTVNLRIWARAGGRLTWGNSPQPQGAVMEKQVGSGGPLLYVSSLNGPVRMDVGQVTALPIPRNPAPQNPARRDNEPPAAPAQPEPRQPEPRQAPPQQQQREVSQGGQPPTQNSEGNPTFKVNVDWVFLNVSVRDRVSNRSLPDLRQDDFVVYEDGVQQTVDQFEPTEVPFNLLLLLDVSGSTESYLHLIKTASIDFTKQIKQNDRIAVAVFNSRVQLVQDFTSSRAEVARAINGVRSGGGTAFYDALDRSVDEYMRSVEGRKAVVVFTDGVDNQLAGNTGEGSRISFDQLYRKVQEIEPIIYPIFLDTEGDAGGMTGNPTSTGGVVGIILGDILGGGRSGRSRRYPGGGGGGVSRAVYDKAREQLQMIADQTGGRMYAPKVIEDLRGVYSEIADDLRVQYRIGYSPTNKAQDGAWRAVRVRIKNNQDAVARTRKGYYARRA